MQNYRKKHGDSPMPLAVGFYITNLRLAL